MTNVANDDAGNDDDDDDEVEDASSPLHPPPSFFSLSSSCCSHSIALAFSSIVVTLVKNISMSSTELLFFKAR